MRACVFALYMLLASSWPSPALAEGMQGSGGAGPDPGGPAITSILGGGVEVPLEEKPDENAPACPEPQPEEDGAEPPSSISETLEKAVESIPELKEGYERFNHCLLDERPCRAREVVSGGAEVLDEAKPVFDAFNSGKGEACESSICKRFFEFASEEPYETPGNRGAISLVFHKGLTRTIVAKAQLYRAKEHKQFHDSAEGLNLNALAAAEYESGKQRELAEALAHLKSSREAGDSWTESDVAALDYYHSLARKRASNQAAAACRLRAYAQKDREAENLQSTISKGQVASGVGLSGITGKGDERGLASTVSGAQENALLLPKGEADARAQDTRDIFSSFDEFRMGEKSQPAEPGLDESLFQRVHRKYRQKDKEGAFSRPEGLPTKQNLL